jgi:hypothetical protein
VNYHDPAIPRARDGRPNLSAPAPRLNGKPDLSGLWEAERTPACEYDRVSSSTRSATESSSWSRSAPSTHMLGTQNLLLFVATGMFMTTGTIWCLVLAWFGAAMSRRLRENPSAGSKLTRASGVMFVGLGVKLAISR